MSKQPPTLEELLRENEILKQELVRLRDKAVSEHGNTVSVPETFRPIFDKAEEQVGRYFKELNQKPTKGTIEVNDERYVLVRASALSYDFVNTFKKLYADRGEDEALSIAHNILFDIGHLIGKEDAKNFHKRMNLTDPVEKLSAGPVHFAYTGWAYVDILEESNPSPDDSFYLKYHHPFSFEADSYLKRKKRSDRPVCIMNAAYSSGWCEESFGMSLTAVEVSCRAKGDDTCTFIMAPPHKITDYVTVEDDTGNAKASIPAFLERKKIEEELQHSLAQKELLLKEVHHRVKNNMQVITSLLNIQANSISDKKFQEKLTESIARVQSMALVHELLYRTGDLSKIDVEEYIRLLIVTISGSYTLETEVDFKVDVNVKHKGVSIDKAIPVGLIINEMVSNSLKYAFPDQKNGSIIISLTENLEYDLMVSDNGIGMLDVNGIGEAETFGLQIIHSLVEQLNGTIELNTENGTHYSVKF